MNPRKAWSAAMVAALVFLVALQSGCAWRRARTNIADMYQRIGRVQEGVTTDEQLIGILGSPPNNVIELAGGRSVLLYTFGDQKTEAFNIILLELSRSNIGIDSALFIVENGVVRKMYVSTNSQDLAWQFWPWGD